MNQLIKNKTNILNFYKKNIEQNKIKKIQLFGSSMLPTIASGEWLNIESPTKFNVGDILVVNNTNRNNFIVHRVIEIDNNLNKVCLLGDNQIDSEKQWFDFKDIIAKVNLDNNSTFLNKISTKIILTLPWLKPTTFDTKSYEVYQSVKAEYNNTYFYDFNIDFFYTIFSKNKIDEFKNKSENSEIFAQNFLNYLKLTQKIHTLNYQLHSFSYNSLAICSPYDEKDIINTIDNYKNTIYYKFYKTKILFLIKKHFTIIKSKRVLKKNNTNSKIYCRHFHFKRKNLIRHHTLDILLPVQNFNQLISAIIFAKILNDILKIKPILIDDSTLFNSKYNTTFVKKYFKKIYSSSFIKKNINTSLTTYNEINFNDYLSKQKIASIRFSNECYYKKCKFCDRHSKDNFYYSAENLYDKIKNLKSLGVNNLIFTDDCIIIPKFLQLLDKLSKNKININWKGTFRFEKMLNDEKVIKMFAENGCKMLFLGLESFDQNYLDLINKGTRIEDCINILKLCKKYNILTSVSFLFNFPGETIEHLKVTEREFIKNIDLIDNCEFNFFMPTKNCKICEQDNKINYFVENKNFTKEKEIIIKNIMDLAIKNKKNMSFYLKSELFS